MRHIYKIVTIIILVIGSPAMGKSIRSDIVQPTRRFRLMKVKGVPHEINYQGWLGTADDTTGVTGTFTMVFKIYDAETDGNNLWSETHEVQVSHGVFNVILGSVNPIPAEIFTGDALWLEVQVGDEVLAPRKKLVSVGYAIQAENAEYAQYADTAEFAVDVGINYVDSAGVAANAWRWNNNTWGIEYPKANVADTAGYALSVDVDYVDSAGVAVNAWRWNNHAWGEKYPEAEHADTATYADTAGYALSVDVNYVDSAGVAVNAWRWNGNTWGVEYPKANIADTATYADTAGYALTADVDYVDSAGVAANAWRWNGNTWGVEYPKANVADTATYVDTAGYALTADVNYVDSAGVAANAWRWSGNMWGVEYPKADRADTANYADTAGYAPDNDWVLETSPANYLRTYGDYGIARKGAVLHGSMAYTHVNLGVVCTTGTAGSDWYCCTVSGGRYNTASSPYATVGGGYDNTASNWYATVGGGVSNTASGSETTVGGGRYNTANGEAATVGGGEGDSASGYAATVSGGYYNRASSSYATVGGGRYNTADTTYATVGGGHDNTASGYAATVSGGYSNTADISYATVGGGYDNTASSSYATVSGGGYNTASGWGATVNGGYYNTASNSRATVGGGLVNTASGEAATIGGGGYNTASGDYAAIPGGAYVKVTGRGSFAFGVGSCLDPIKVDSDYVVAFGDGGEHNYKFGINREDPQHPLQVGTNSSNGNGAYLTAGGTWTNASSRELKEDFIQLDAEEVLDKLKSLLVCMWRYKGTNEYHIGPMAEDFYKIFGTGTDDKHLSSSDVSGVALIAIKELIRKIEAQQQVIKAQQEEIELLKNRVAEFEQLLKDGK